MAQGHRVGTDFPLNNGTNIPAIGLATLVDASTTKEDVVQALKLGYRHLDCALWGFNQEQVGQAIKEVGVNRSELFITGKLWNTHHRRHSSHEDLEITLKQLQVHYLDLWLMHWPLAFVGAGGQFNTTPATDASGKAILDDGVTLLETWRAMEAAYKDGKARAIGLANVPLHMLQEILTEGEVVPAVVHVELHPYLQQDELVHFCQHKGIHVESYSPYGSQAPGDVDILADPVLHEIGKNHNKTPGQVILNWIVSRRLSTLPNATDPKHMKEHLEIFDFNLTDEETTKIKKLDRGLRYWSPLKLWGTPLFPDEKTS